MNRSDCDEVARIIAELWPTQAKRELTSENINLWMGVWKAYPVEWVVQVMRGAKETSQFFPKMPEIRARLKAMAERHRTSDDAGTTARAAEQRERDEHDRRWHEVAEYLAGLTDEEQQQHKSQALADDRRLRWMVTKPVTDRWWRAMIYRRLCMGLNPSDPAPEPLFRPEQFEGSMSRGGESIVQVDVVEAIE